MSEETRVRLPDLPSDVRGTARAFHRWCNAELERRQTRDVDLDLERFQRAARLVLGRLGAPTDAP